LRDGDLKNIDLAFGRILRRGQNAVDLMARNVGDKFEMDLSAWAFPILGELMGGPLRPSEVARRIGIGRSTVTRHLQDMEGKDLVMRVKAEADRGGVMLALTAKGVKLAEASANERLAELGQVLAAWSDERVACLAALLGDLDHEMAHARVVRRDLSGDRLK
jgi:DNA-binding MarR family transcriptional regulator